MTIRLKHFSTKTKKITEKTMKVRIAYCIQNQGDGSYSPLFYNTIKEANKVEEWELEHGEPICESTGWVDLEFDDSGNLLNGDKTAEQMEAERLNDIRLYGQ
jgi:hypothetical protein